MVVIKVLKGLLDENAREVKRMARRVEEINQFEGSLQPLSDAQLQGKTSEFKKRLAQGESLDDLLPEAFAVVREASRRVLNMRHFDVQMMGGMVLHSGRIAEMKTGEGKTLVATLPVYLNALTEQGVHVVTVNDYLATRDSEWMGQLYQFLGLSVGLIVHGLDSAQRRAAYAADVTYGTNNEFGFDYLRDNMAINQQGLVQRELHFAIVDEVDSILIDEARTPLIISGEADKPTDLYYTVARMIPRLVRETDYTVDEKANLATLTEEGMQRVEKNLNIPELFEGEHMEIVHHVNQGLRAHALMRRDKDYVVKDGQVIIVDEFTGRLMFGRRYSEGLHQAIEAKEGVKVARESKTLATITFQNLFRMYDKLAGMTGTALTEEEEFRKIYKVDVVVIPTNMPMIRADHPDSIYRTEEGKFQAVVEEIAECHAQGQPVLVGTISIEKSEHLSKLLKKRGIPHQVLNAKYHEMEASIVAQAGRKGAVTIATNMAGRGTDIVLGGNPEFLARTEVQQQIKRELQNDPDAQPDPELLEERYAKYLAEQKRETEKEHQLVAEHGGLHIIGTERHESRRIDNQLRGRSGRQGDPGASRFYISLEDDLMRMFGSEAIGGLMDRLGMDDSTPIENNMVSRSIENAQRKVESRNFDIRKNVLQYDDVMNQQREIIYAQRRDVLFGESVQETLLDMLEKVVDETLETFAGESQYPEEWDLHALLESAEQVFLPGHEIKPESLHSMNRAEVREYLWEQAQTMYSQREEEIGTEQLREIERVVLLRMVDSKWMDHLDAMDQLRQGIGLRAYAQRDPLIEYKFEAFQMFQDMIKDIQTDTIRWVFRARIAEPQREPARRIVENRTPDEGSQPKQTEPKIGRNDPCPCGSGRKYKKCCGK